MNNSIRTRYGVIFDMDDTLYKEHTYRDSGYRTIARHFAASCGTTPEELYNIILSDRRNAMENVMELAATYGVSVSVDDQLKVYRTHRPDIELNSEARKILNILNRRGDILGIITDGRAWGQLNKIAALGLTDYIEPDLIMPTVLYDTDKHHPDPFMTMEAKVRDRGAMKMVYVGDNPSKDFYYPNIMGWITVMLRDSKHENIHPQCINDWPAEYRPQVTINTLLDIPNILI